MQVLLEILKFLPKSAKDWDTHTLKCPSLYLAKETCAGQGHSQLPRAHLGAKAGTTPWACFLIKAAGAQGHSAQLPGTGKEQGRECQKYKWELPPLHNPAAFQPGWTELVAILHYTPTPQKEKKGNTKVSVVTTD